MDTEALHTRREARRRALRRRRRHALRFLTVPAGARVVLILSSRSGGSSKATGLHARSGNLANGPRHRGQGPSSGPTITSVAGGPPGKAPGPIPLYHGI